MNISDELVALAQRLFEHYQPFKRELKPKELRALLDEELASSMGDPKHIYEAIKRGPRTPEPFTVYRGMGLPPREISALERKGALTLYGPSSTSLHPSIAERFARQNTYNFPPEPDDPLPLILQLELPQGSHGLYLDALTTSPPYVLDEKAPIGRDFEFLLPRKRIPIDDLERVNDLTILKSRLARPYAKGGLA